MFCADMKTWIRDNEGRIYSYLVYKKLFTPYEQEHTFMDESQFEDIQYRTALIEEAIELGNGDWLIGFREIIDDEVCGIIHYHRLSDIQIALFEQDQNMLQQESEEDE